MAINKKLEEDICTIAGLHKKAKLDIEKKCYDHYVHSILEKETGYRRQLLERYEKLKF